MTHDITEYDENKHIGNDTEDSAPPLCLVHYYAERAAYPPERHPKPPGAEWVGRVAERHGNLIILDFAPPPAPEMAKTKRSGRSLLTRTYEALMLLLLLACLLGCLAAFRF